MHQPTYHRSAEACITRSLNGGQGVAALTVALLAAAGSLGCGERPATVPRADAAAAPAPAAPAPAAPALSRQPPSAADRQLSALLDRWMRQVAQKPAVRPRTVPASTAHPEVVIDLTVLASHHPAWRLAATLDSSSGQTTPAPVSQVSAPAGLSVARMPLPVSLPQRQARRAPSPSIISRPAGGLVVSGVRLPAMEISAPGIAAAQADERRAQEDAMNNFMSAARQQAVVSEGEVARGLRAALEEDIRVAQERATPILQSPLPDPATQLRMTNLRLQVLRNMHGTEADKQQAEQALADLERRWQRQLTQSAQDESEKRIQLRRDLPRRLRAEGESKIATTLTTVQARQQMLRAAAMQAVESQLNDDFSPSSERLALVLPAARLAPQRLAPAGRASAAGAAPVGLLSLQASGRLREPRTLSDNIFQTLPLPAPSVAKSIPLGVAPGSVARRGQEAAALRAWARRDARRWAGLAARRQGWNWHAGTVAGKVLPDRTAAVLRMLAL